MEYDTYRRWLDSCLKMKIPAITTDTAARLMAVLYEYGNNEGFTYNQRFLADMEYIQNRFHIHGSEVVDNPEFVSLLKGYIKELQLYQKAHYKDERDPAHPYRYLAPDWAPELLKERYNMKFIG